MKKILIGVVALIVVLAAVWYGAQAFGFVTFYSEAAEFSPSGTPQSSTICHGWSKLLRDDRPVDGPASFVCIGKAETISHTDTTVDTDVPTLTQAELARGWYYGDLNQKKPGTPSSWVHANAGSRSAMWKDPNLTEVRW